MVDIPRDSNLFETAEHNRDLTEGSVPSVLYARHSSATEPIYGVRDTRPPVQAEGVDELVKDIDEIFGGSKKILEVDLRLND